MYLVEHTVIMNKQDIELRLRSGNILYGLARVSSSELVFNQDLSSQIGLSSKPRS